MIQSNKLEFKHVLHEFDVPAVCPWALWLPAWRGWRTSLCLQTNQPGRPHLLPVTHKIIYNLCNKNVNILLTCNAPIAADWKRRSVLKSCAISLTNL